VEFTPPLTGQTANDYWRAGRAGFRGDWTMGGGHRLTLSGQAYYGTTGDTWQVPDIGSPAGVTLTDMHASFRRRVSGLSVRNINPPALAGGCLVPRSRPAENVRSHRRLRRRNRFDTSSLSDLG
jgi:hypothetical protein